MIDRIERDSESFSSQGRVAKAIWGRIFVEYLISVHVE